MPASQDLEARERRLRCSGAGYPCLPQGSRRCASPAVATTLPHVIALGSVCAVRAPSIVARDGGTVAERGQMYERQGVRGRHVGGDKPHA